MDKSKVARFLWLTVYIGNPWQRYM